MDNNQNYNGQDNNGRDYGQGGYYQSGYQGGNNYENRGAPYTPQYSESDYAYKIVTEEGKPKNIGATVASMVCGIASVVISFDGIFAILGIMLAIAAIILSVVGRKKLGYFNGFAIAGLITGIFGIVFGITSILIEFVFYELLEGFFGAGGGAGTPPDINGGF